jgi:non-heme chloroperoxidase
MKTPHHTITSHMVEGREVLSCLPQNPRFATPLLFIHGAFCGAWMFADDWLGRFADAGFAAHALSLRGHGNSIDRDRLDFISIDEYVEDVAVVADWLGLPPALIGHSMGGFVAQKYLEEHAAPAAALLCSVPPQGLAASQMRLFLKAPGLLQELNNALNGRRVDRAMARRTLFGQPVSDEVVDAFIARAQPESLRAIMDMSGLDLPRLAPWQRPPMLIAGCGRDVLIPPFMVESNALAYSVEPVIFPDMGHILTHDLDEAKAARTVSDWLTGVLEDLPANEGQAAAAA